MPWLFTSMNLKDLVEITPSVKTRLAMIGLIGPRLIDPRAKIDYFLGLFRFSEEKEKVQEILKTRTHVLSSSAFRTGFSLSPVAGADSTAAPKPFVAIPGMGKARERVTKPIVKLKKPTEVPPENTTKPPGTKPPGKGTPLEKVWENGSSPPRIPVVKKPLERIFESRAASPPKRAASPPKRAASPPKRAVSPPRATRAITPPKVNREVSPPKVTRAVTPPRVREASPPKVTRPVSPPKVQKVVAFEKAEEIEPSPRRTVAEEPEPEEQESAPVSIPIPAPIPTPIIKPTPILKPPAPVQNKVELKMGNGTYNVGPTKRRSIPNREALRTIVTILPVIADPVSGIPQTPVYVISDDSDSDNYGSEGTATETKNGLSSDPLDSTKRQPKLVVDVTLTKSPSQSSLGPPSPGSCGKNEPGSSGKNGRNVKSQITKKFSPKYTPLAEGGTLIARDDKEDTGLAQSRLEYDMVNAEIVNMPPMPMPIIEKKKNGAKGPKKSVRMAAPPSPPRGSRNAMSMSSHGQSQNGRSDGTGPSPDRTTIDIYASNELARSWRKSTRFVNVKSLAYDFDRMKERGEKQQKRRSQTPDRRYPKTEEKHGDDEDDDEEKDSSTDPQPWYITDKLDPRNIKPNRQNEQPENGGRRHSANDSLPEKNNSTTGQFLPNGAPLPNGGLVRGLSFYAKLPSEGPVEKAADGTPLFRHQELVRMNAVRSYDGINQSDLENYMVDTEFVKCFGMSKVRTS